MPCAAQAGCRRRQGRGYQSAPPVRFRRSRFVSGAGAAGAGAAVAVVSGAGAAVAVVSGAGAAGAGAAFASSVRGAGWLAGGGAVSAGVAGAARYPFRRRTVEFVFVQEQEVKADGANDDADADDNERAVHFLPRCNKMFRIPMDRLQDITIGTQGIAGSRFDRARTTRRPEPLASFDRIGPLERKLLRRACPEQPIRHHLNYSICSECVLGFRNDGHFADSIRLLTGGSERK